MALVCRLQQHGKLPCLLAIVANSVVSVGAMQAVVQQLQQLFLSSRPYVHSAVDTAVIVPGKGPLTLDTAAAGESSGLT
jgi:hypothetical protein